MSLRICVYAISRNEEKFVDRFCEAAKDADCILVADTGSTDDTVKWLRSKALVEPLKFRVHSITVKPWRFDLARNAALALIPNDVDVCVSLDLDEELQPGWREEIERVWKPDDTTRLRYKFDWGVGIVFYYEKIHARWGYRWHHPCHEYPVPYGITESWAQTDKLLVIHKPDPTKSRGQYLPLLKMSIEEDPLDPRNAFYYARELSFNRQWDASIAECHRYLALPRADWPNERCYAYRTMGRCYTEKGDLINAERAFLQAAMEAPDTREPWFELSALMYRRERWEQCLAFGLRCLSIVNRELVYTVDPHVWGAQPHDYVAIAAYHLGIKKLAVEHAQLAVDKAPTEMRYRSNLAFCQAMDLPPDPPAPPPIIERKPDPGPLAVPNIVHFVWFTGPKSRDFSYLNYLAVRRAAEVQMATTIFMHCNEEPVGNKHWELIRKFVTIHHVEIPDGFEGVRWGMYPHYWSDLVRLRELERTGGIYLDTDALLLKPLTALMDHDCVLAGGTPPPGFRNQTPCVSAATILARPHAPFIQHWLESFASKVGTTEWSGAMTDFPLELYAEHPDELTLIPLSKFLPFDWTNENVLKLGDTREFDWLTRDSYVAHFWDTMWSARLAQMPNLYFSERLEG